MRSLRYAWRSLAKSPGFVVVAVLALGFGLGLATTMFAVLDAVVNPHVPYYRPDRLFNVRWWAGVRNAAMTPYDLYRAVRDETRSFAGTARRGLKNALLETGEPREVWARSVSPDYFGLVGLRPEHGRLFHASDGDAVAVVGRDIWRSVFGTSRFTPGRTLTLSGRAHSVVGILPPGADAIFTPLPEGASQPDAALYGTLQPVVRLRDGVTPQQASDELHLLARLLTDRHGAQAAPYAFELTPFVMQSEPVRDAHVALVGAALIVLIVACVNLAHLMLARGLAKRRDLALRLALGANRAAVVREMFVECALITLAGSVLGALAAIWGTDILANRMPPEVRWVGLLRPQLSWRVFGLGAFSAAAAAAVFGLLPAIRVATQIGLNEPLKDAGSTTTGRNRQRYSALVITEVALALVLLMGGALLVRATQELGRYEPGFNARTLLVGGVIGRRPQPGAPLPTVRPRQMVDAAASAPGVLDVALAGWRQARGHALTAEMVGGDTARIISMYGFPVVSANYFRVLGLPILRGRDFEPGDGLGDGVAILDAVAAAQLYPSGDAVGRMLQLGGPGSGAPWIRIVGVARSPMSERWGRVPRVWVHQDAERPGQLLIRVADRSPRVEAALRLKLREVPGVLSSYLYPFDSFRESEIASSSFLAKIFVSMATASLALAALGLYGVLAYAVGQRMREFAVRIALGAQPHQLFRMVLHDGLVMLLAGIATGAFAALIASKYVDPLLPEVIYRTDWISLVASEALVVVVGLAAAMAPARRAVRANPLDIIRAV